MAFSVINMAYAYGICAVIPMLNAGLYSKAEGPCRECGRAGDTAGAGCVLASPRQARPAIYLAKCPLPAYGARP